MIYRAVPIVLGLFLLASGHALVEDAEPAASEEAPATPTVAAFQGKGPAQEKFVAELSPEAERAIERGLRYISQTQNSDGSWSSSTHVSVTSLCLMAYMVKGYFPNREPYGDVMAKGVDFLLRSARTNNGYLGVSMYDHAMGTLALSEVWGESNRSSEIREALKNAVSVIVNSQVQRGLAVSNVEFQEAGGWGYQPNRSTAHWDISITVMQIVALASAREAGILVPDSTMKQAVKYVKSCQRPDGSFGYRYASDQSLGRVAFARTAAGVTSLMMAGERNCDEVKRGMAYLHNPGRDTFGHGVFDIDYNWFYYGHYYAVQAMYQSGEKDYRFWYPRVRDTLVRAQMRDGSWIGGIPPNTRTKVETDRNSYCTPMAVLVLGVPYRFLPIYQR